MTTVAEATKTAPKTTSQVFERVYEISVNERKGAYHPLPKKLREEEARPSYISSEFISEGGGAILRGLTNYQERFFGSRLINKTPKDNGFDEAMTSFWADFRITVPKKGLTLDASFKKVTKVIDGEEVEIEEPVNLNDYMKAKFAMKNSRVAFTKEEKSNKSLFDFIMVDLSEAKRARESMFEIETKAMSEFTKLLEEVTSGKDNEKVHFLLDILQKPNDNFFGLNVKDKLMELKKIMLDDPNLFYNAVNDPKLSTKSRFFRLVQTRVIILEGETYFFDDISLGTKNEAIAYLEDNSKTGITSKMIARLNEKLK